MVEERHSEGSNKEEVHIQEWTASSTDPDDEDDCQPEGGQEIFAPVRNLSDVHFGNNNYYQGPVAIKQVVYKEEDEDIKLAIENEVKDEIKPEIVIHVNDENSKREEQHDVQNVFILNKDNANKTEFSQGAVV